MYLLIIHYRPDVPLVPVTSDRLMEGSVSPAETPSFSGVRGGGLSEEDAVYSLCTNMKQRRNKARGFRFMASYSRVAGWKTSPEGTLVPPQARCCDQRTGRTGRTRRTLTT